MNHAPSCERCLQDLAAILPDPPAPGSELARHVERCARCTREWREMQQLAALLVVDEPGLEELAEARLGLRRRLAAEPIPTRRAASAVPSRWLLRARPLLVHAAGFLLSLGLMVPIARSLSPLDRTPPTEAAGRGLEADGSVDGVWRRVRDGAGELESWTPRLGLQEWFGMIPGRREGMLPELPAIPSTVPSSSG